MVFRYEFVPYGTVAPVGAAPGRLFLDVGSGLGRGVIDHHQVASYLGSATSLVAAHPDLVLEAGAAADGALTIVLHRHPDLDCLAASFLAEHLLVHGSLPDGAEVLAAFADRVDGGYLGMSAERPCTLYAACTLLAHRLSQRPWRTDAEMWRRLVRDGHEVIAFVLDEIARRGTPILDVDAFATYGLFGPQDRADMMADRSRYDAKLADAATHATLASLRLPAYLGETRELDALLVRDVQGVGDPARCMFFKDWARSDCRRAPSGQGFAALSVWRSATASETSRCIVSVKPEAGVSLRGLGARLEAAEREARVALHGRDDRDVDASTGLARPPRPGYAGADPWYDGRAHGFTIVDSPASGTLLPVDEVERSFLDFGRGGGSVAPLVLADPGAVGDGPGSFEARQGLSILARQAALALPAAAAAPIPAPPVFISYCRRNLAWVDDNVFAPLARRIGAGNVFLDRHSIVGGASWVHSIATAVASSRVFLAVYSRDYFASNFCIWELEMAVMRDPRGTGGVILPVALEPVEIPLFCAAIHAEDASRPGFGKRLLAIVESRLAVERVPDRG